MILSNYYRNNPTINFSQKRINNDLKSKTKLTKTFFDLNRLFLDKIFIDSDFKTFSNDILQNKEIINQFENDLNQCLNFIQFFSIPKTIENFVLNQYLNRDKIYVENKFIPIFIFKKGNKNKIFYQNNEIVIFLNQKKITKITLHNMLNQILKIYKNEE